MIEENHGMNFHPRFPEIPLPVFSGEPNENVLDFIENFESYADIHSYDDTLRIKVFRWCLRGEALQAYKNNKTQYDSYRKWEEVKGKFIIDFVEDPIAGYFSAFCRRKQLPTERTLSYVRDKLELLRFSKIEIPEKEQVELLTEGLLPDVRSIVQIMKPKTLSDFEADVCIATNSSLSFTQSDKNFQVLSTDSYPTSNYETKRFPESEFQERGQYARGNSSNSFISYPSSSSFSFFNNADLHNSGNTECSSLQSLANWQDINLKLDWLLKMRLGESEENVEFTSQLKASYADIGQDSEIPVQEVEFQKFPSDSHLNSVYFLEKVKPDASSVLLSQIECDFAQKETENIVTCLNLTVPNNQVFLAQNEYSKNDEFDDCLHNGSLPEAIKLDPVEEVVISQSVELPKIFANFKIDLATSDFLSDSGYVGAAVKEGNAFNSLGAVNNFDVENTVRITSENGQNINQVNQKLSVDENFDQDLLAIIIHEADIFVEPSFVKPGTPKSKDDTYSLQADENYFEEGNNCANEEAWCLESKNVSYKEVYSRKQKNNSSLRDQLENGHHVKFQNNETSKLRLNEFLGSSFEVFYRDQLPNFKNESYGEAQIIDQLNNTDAPKFGTPQKDGIFSLQKGENRNWKFRKKNCNSFVAHFNNFLENSICVSLPEAA